MKNVLVHAILTFLIVLPVVSNGELTLTVGNGKPGTLGFKAIKPNSFSSIPNQEPTLFDRWTEANDLETGVCRPSGSLSTNGATRLGNEVSASLRYKHCGFGVFQFGLLSRKSCEEAEVCASQFRGKFDLPNIQSYLKDIISADYAKNFLKEKIGTMERTELARKELEDYYKVKPKCSNRFDFATQFAKECKQESARRKIDEAYSSFLKTCDRSQDGENCPVNKDESIKSFESHTVSRSDKRGLLSSYFDKRIQEKRLLSSQHTNVALTKLSALFATEAFKKLSQEDKIKSFLTHFGQDELGRIQDPYFALEFDNLSSKSSQLLRDDRFKSFLDLFNKKNLSASDFVDEFHKIKKEKLTKKFVDLSGAKCGEMASITQLCVETSNMEEFKSSQLSKVNPLVMENFFSSKVIDENALINVKQLIKDDYLTNKEADVLVNHLRCKMYGPNNYVKPDASPDLASSGSSQSSDDHETYTSMTLSPKSSDVSPELSRFAGSNSHNSADSGNKTSDFEGKQDGQNLPLKPITPASPDIVPSNQTSDGINSPAYGQSMIASAYQQTVNGGVPFIPLAPQSDPKIDVVSPKGPSVDSRVQDLMAKLAEAEARVKKLEDDPVVAGSDEEQENLAASELERSKVSALEKEIADLKAQVAASKKEDGGKSPKAERTIASGDNSGGFKKGNEGSIETREAQTKTSKGSGPNSATGLSGGSVNNNGAGSSNAIASKAGAASKDSSRSGSGTAILTTAGAVGGVSTIKLANGESFTYYSGLAKEKVAEMIVTRFKNSDNNKAPFFIEEAGYVKEVVPILDEKGELVIDAEGKPTYTVFIKGKLGEKKYAIAKPDAKRAPAAIVDRAELAKRDSAEVERLRSRAEYQRMKDSTIKAIKKKD